MLRFLFRVWRIRARAAKRARAVVVHWRLWQLRQAYAHATKFARSIYAARWERKTFEMWRKVARRICSSAGPSTASEGAADAISAAMVDATGGAGRSGSLGAGRNGSGRNARRS